MKTEKTSNQGERKKNLEDSSKRISKLIELEGKE
jgi:hypothetical protein